MTVLAAALLLVDPIFHAADARGAAVVLDVRTGEVVAARDPDRSVLPLSVIKLYVAADFWERGLEGSLDDMLVFGLDQPGKDRALELRKKIGGAAVLDDLRRMGLPLSLPADAGDATWGETLSIGEEHARVTPLQVARFLREVAAARTRTGHELQRAMRECVLRGTARSVAPRQAGARFSLGGKTGTGPAGAKPYDGWFAGLIFVGDEPRYTVAVYVDGKGPGGGVAASIAAELARSLLPK